MDLQEKLMRKYYWKIILKKEKIILSIILMEIQPVELKKTLRTKQAKNIYEREYFQGILKLENIISSK